MCRGGPGQRRLRSGVGVYEDDSGNAEPRVWGKGQSSNLEPITAARVGAELTLWGTRVAPCHSSLPASLAPHPCDCKYGAVCVASVLVHRKHERKVQRGPEAEKQGQLYWTWHPTGFFPEWTMGQQIQVPRCAQKHKYALQGF